MDADFPIKHGRQIPLVPSHTRFSVVQYVSGSVRVGVVDKTFD